MVAERAACGVRFERKRKWQLYVVGADGGKPLRIPLDFQLAAKPSWPPDGEWIFFSGISSTGAAGLWRVREDGSDLTTVEDGSIYAPQVSSDGDWVYYKLEQGIWRVPTQGGKAETVVESGSTGQMAVAARGMFFTRRDPETGQVGVFFKGVAEGEVLDTGAAVSAGDAGRWVPIHASRDGRRLVVVQQAVSESDILLVENFE